MSGIHASEAYMARSARIHSLSFDLGVCLRRGQNCSGREFNIPVLDGRTARMCACHDALINSNKDNGCRHHGADLHAGAWVQNQGYAMDPIQTERL